MVRQALQSSLGDGTRLPSKGAGPARGETCQAAWPWGEGETAPRRFPFTEFGNARIMERGTLHQDIARSSIH